MAIGTYARDIISGKDYRVEIDTVVQVGLVQMGCCSSKPVLLEPTTCEYQAISKCYESLSYGSALGSILKTIFLWDNFIDYID